MERGSGDLYEKILFNSTNLFIFIFCSLLFPPKSTAPTVLKQLVVCVFEEAINAAMILAPHIYGCDFARNVISNITNQLQCTRYIVIICRK